MNESIRYLNELDRLKHEQMKTIPREGSLGEGVETSEGGNMFDNFKERLRMEDEEIERSQQHAHQTHQYKNGQTTPTVNSQSTSKKNDKGVQRVDKK